MIDAKRREQVEELIREAGSAHQEVFSETDGVDPDWPVWYAVYLIDKLGDLLNARLTKSELVYLLVMAAKEQLSRAPGGDWARYYARFFVERYG